MRDVERADVRRGPGLDLIRLVLGDALDDGARMSSGCVEVGLEPARVGTTVVVGECDERRTRRAPSEVALARRMTGARLDADLAQHARLGECVPLNHGAC